MQINNVADFTLPLKTLKNSINSVIFSISPDKRLMLNVKSQDGAQIVNLKWNTDVVDVPKDMEKIGIYNLGEFLTALEMFSSTKIACNIDENKLDINYEGNADTKVKYNLSDINLIQDGPEGPKNKIDYFANITLNAAFLKKVKTIASSLNVNTLKLECKDGEISYSVSDKYFHSHIVKEKIVEGVESKDFEVFVNIEKLAVIPEGKEIKLNIHDKVLEFEIVNKDKDSKNKYPNNWMRYFIAALSTE